MTPKIPPSKMERILAEIEELILCAREEERIANRKTRESLQVQKATLVGVINDLWEELK